MLIGYDRVYTKDKTLELQTDVLTREGSNKTFTDTASGAKFDRPGLAEAMSHLRSGYLFAAPSRLLSSGDDGRDHATLAGVRVGEKGTEVGDLHLGGDGDC